MAVAEDKQRMSVTVAEETTEALDKLAVMLDPRGWRNLSRAAVAGLLLDGLPHTDQGLKLLAAKLRRTRSTEVYRRAEKASRRRLRAAS